ncbi:MAG: alcohol dehydrogenase catalytic domain-containing protein, partial [Chromatiales bacterium]|nr:alcohol dehydrogenase catalytic domain-containing protein [Chromatiales bacterium]
MKAILMQQPGEASSLVESEVNAPTLVEADQLLIKLEAAGVNPIDTKLRANGTYFPDQLPTILGCDGSGRVVEVGAEVKNFHVGDEVYYFYGGIGGAEQGNYAEYNVISEAYVAPKPSNLSFSEAAAVPLALITAWESLHHRTVVKKGESVLIHAGAGGVGHLAIQLAKIAGCRVITTVSSKEKEKFVRSL